jgi:hypothetical protein
MEIRYSEMVEYLINEQDYTEDEVADMPIEEVLDLYEMYHED